MAEKRSLFKTIFGSVSQFASRTFNRLQMLNGYVSIFTPWGNNPYDADIVRGAIDAIARNAAKLKPKHVRRVNGILMPLAGTSNIEYVLQVRPNPFMSAFDFYYKMITMLMVDNNAFAYPVWEGTKLKEVWPISCNSAEFLEDQTGTIFLRFNFGTGNNVVMPYDNIIHLRRHFYKSDLLGEPNSPLSTILDALHTSTEGIGQAVKTSASLRGIIKFQGILSEKDITANKDKFVDEYLSITNKGGIAALDSKAEYKELTNDPKIVNASQLKEMRDIVYRYFGINEKIIMSQWSDQEWNAFYESTLEPLAVQMSLEFTYKLFTAGERGRGNEIMFEANRLQYANVNTKISIIKEMTPIGMLSINEGREILNLGPVDGGDKRLVSLNYVSADKADKYQVGEDDTNGETDITE